MRAAAAILVLVVALSPLTANAIDVWGDQWGTWTRDNSPYNVIGEIRVPPESTLVIEPGVLVNFKGHYKLIVDSLATLLAVGTEADSIYFTPEDTATGWHGIRFLHADSNSQISYCWFEHGKAAGDVHEDRNGGAIYCYYSSPTISNSFFTHNCAASYGGGIYCHSSAPTISDNTISNNSAFRGGGIHCGQSSPAISNNIINGNSADEVGGGICCRDHSSPTISDNTISTNSAVYVGGGISCHMDSSPAIARNIIRENSSDGGGGGICCHDASATINDNRIIGNSSFDGGGINCTNSSATITSNTITGNFADGYGGAGIFCYLSNPVISNNIISQNSAFHYYERVCGGGIYCSGCSPTISSNTIFRNSACYSGGAIFCDYSSATISNNTISGNSADSRAGAIACWNDSSPSIINTILWGDVAPNNPEIYIQSGNPIVTYCDVQGGWPGTGNIDAEPIFAGPYNDDFHLRWHSPCINAGDPSLTDPDGTRSDIGAFYFNLAVLGIVEVYPHDEPIVIPPQGGDITYDGGVLNLSRGNLTVDIWAQAFVPGLSRPHRLWRHNDITIPFADSIIRADLIEHVPGYGPSGDYSFVTYIGDFPSSIIDSSCMYFTKEGAAYASAGGDSWQSLKGWFDGDSELSEATLPTAYSLSQNYPNPFNATTVINYQLPVGGEVTLEVYNTLGQRVKTLVDSKQQAGYRTVVWDASEISSGIYFYRLTAGDYAETKRMMLVK